MILKQLKIIITEFKIQPLPIILPLNLSGYSVYPNTPLSQIPDSLTPQLL
jgi:hypothetical protein